MLTLIKFSTVAALAAAAVMGTACADLADRKSAVCAAHDLHIIDQIEEAGRWNLLQPIHLVATFEGVLRARRLCAEGHGEEAVRMYERLDLGIMRKWRLQ